MNDPAGQSAVQEPMTAGRPVRSEPGAKAVRRALDDTKAVQAAKPGATRHVVLTLRAALYRD